MPLRSSTLKNREIEIDKEEGKEQDCKTSLYRAKKYPKKNIILFILKISYQVCIYPVSGRFSKNLDIRLKPDIWSLPALEKRRIIMTPGD